MKEIYSINKKVNQDTQKYYINNKISKYFIILVSLLILYLIYLFISLSKNQNENLIKSLKSDSEAFNYDFERSFRYSEIILQNISAQIAKNSRNKNYINKTLKNFYSNYGDKIREILSISVFSWVDKYGMLTVNGEFGILKEPKNLIDRDYLKYTQKTPNKLIFGSAVIGGVSGIYILPAGIGVFDDNSRYLGSIVMGFTIDNLVKNFSKNKSLENIDFDLIYKDLGYVRKSSKNPAVNLQKINFNDINYQILTPLCIFKSCDIAIYKKIKGIDYGIVIFAKANKLDIIKNSHLFEVALITVLLIIFLLAFRQKFVKPLKTISGIYKSDSKSLNISLPKTNISEMLGITNVVIAFRCYMEKERARQMMLFDSKGPRPFSHDIKNYTYGILGMADLIANRKVSNDKNDNNENLSSNQALARIITLQSQEMLEYLQSLLVKSDKFDYTKEIEKIANLDRLVNKQDLIDSGFLKSEEDELLDNGINNNKDNNNGNNLKDKDKKNNDNKINKLFKILKFGNKFGNDNLTITGQINPYNKSDELNNKEQENNNISLTSFDVKSMIEIILVNNKNFADEHLVSFAVNFINELPLLRCNKNSFRAVLDNIINNAIKYNKTAGKVFINAKYIEKDDDNDDNNNNKEEGQNQQQEQNQQQNQIQQQNQDIKGYIYLEVIDEGIGMSKEDINKALNGEGLEIDKSQLRAELKAKGKKFESYGIGMKIIKDEIPRMNAKIDIESTKGLGTKFKLWFEVRKSHQNPQDEATIRYLERQREIKRLLLQINFDHYTVSGAANDSNLTHNQEQDAINNINSNKQLDLKNQQNKFRKQLIAKDENLNNVIIIADDEMIIATNLEMQIKRMVKNAKIVRATNGYEVLKILETTICSIIFIDNQMPHLSGIQTIKMIRNKQFKNNLHQSNITIIANSSNDDSESIKQLINSGANKFISKKLIPQEIRESLLLSGNWVEDEK